MKTGLGINRNGLCAALDVGSSKICCFIADLDRGEQPQVLGIGYQASAGVKNGAVIDMDNCEKAIRNAVHSAEQMAGETIDRVLVNLSGGYPASSSVAIEVSIAGHEVGDTDLQRALYHSKSNGEEPSQLERQLIHTIPVNYSIDGSRGVRDPRGMFGDRLAVMLHMITANTSAVRNLATCIQRCHLEVSGFVVSPYAAGLATLVPDEKELGVTVIDMGGGTTTIAVFFEGKVIYTDVVPVGGNHVTNDIARGLSTPLAHAERMKTLYGHAVVAAADDRELIDVPQVGESEHECDMQQVARSILIGIIHPRLEETFELVRSRLEASGFDKVAGRRVVLTGGASQLPGLRDLAALLLDKQVRIGRPNRAMGLAEATSGPAFATCAGLLNFAASEAHVGPLTAAEANKEAGSLTGRLGSWFREHF